MDAADFGIALLSFLAGAAAGIFGYIQLAEKPSPAIVGVLAAKAPDPEPVVEEMAPTAAQPAKKKRVRKSAAYPPARKKSSKK